MLRSSLAVRHATLCSAGHLLAGRLRADSGRPRIALEFHRAWDVADGLVRHQTLKCCRQEKFLSQEISHG